MEQREQILFIINPISGTGSKAVLEKMIVELIDTRRFDPFIKYSKYAGHSLELAQEARDKGISNLVAVGGDGTINELGNVLKGSNTNLGIIPTGSGNGLARHLGISMITAEAIKGLNTAQVRRIDAGEMNGKAFFCTAGMGFDAHIGKVFAEAGHRGLGTYVQKTLSEYLTYVPQKYVIHSDGKKQNKTAFLITFANAAQYGNNAMIAPMADIEDGKLDMCIMSPFPAFAGLDMGRRLFDGTIPNSKFTKMSLVTKVTVEREGPGPVHVDGEPMEMGERLEIEIKPKCLNVLVPMRQN